MNDPQLVKIQEAVEEMARRWGRKEAALRDALTVARDDLEAMTDENKTIRAAHASLEAMLVKLLDLCDEQDQVADELRVPREDGSIDVKVIREVLG